jgi:hypothetical protein
LGEEYRSLNSSLCTFLHSPVTSTLIATNILNTYIQLRKKLVKCTFGA